ncbi:MAG TPA: protein phosphatase 2C domain-containing protein [Acidobacteriota bacterium]|nr:protein phosphatase 2C domain-containing protein [Acidobacteriota bacterium]
MKDPRDLDTADYEFPAVTVPLHPPVPFSSLVKIDFGACTNMGNVRKNNEDAYLICRTGRYWERLHTNLGESELPDRFDENGYAMAVADGMGGAVGGEIASSMTLRLCVSLTLNAAKWALKLDNPETRDYEIQKTMERCEAYFRKVDQLLTQQVDANPWLKGMGTTLTGAYSTGDDLFVIQIGDSRAYLSRRGHLQRLTHDHTVAQLLADMGDITPDQVATHQLRHTLTSSLGGREGKVKIDVQHLQLIQDDRLLLCSDGLTEMVRDEIIAEVMSKDLPAQTICQELVDRALQAGGEDNVTVAMARYSIPPRPKQTSSHLF